MGRSGNAYQLTMKRMFSIALCMALCVGTATNFELPLEAQNQNTQATSNSDLARQNLSLVAASAGEIKPILLKDAGLMVELKRWLAKDASNHGQVIAETDLTNDAI